MLSSGTIYYTVMRGAIWQNFRSGVQTIRTKWTLRNKVAVAVPCCKGNISILALPVLPLLLACLHFKSRTPGLPRLACRKEAFLQVSSCKENATGFSSRSSIWEKNKHQYCSRRIMTTNVCEIDGECPCTIVKFHDTRECLLYIGA